MTRWICSTKVSDQRSMSQLKDMLRIPKIKDVLRYSRLKWFGHLERMPNDNWSKKVTDCQIPPGVNIRGSQKKWNHNVKKDMESLGLKTCQRRFQIFRVQKGTHNEPTTAPPWLATSGETLKMCASRYSKNVLPGCLLFDVFATHFRNYLSLHYEKHFRK